MFEFIPANWNYAVGDWGVLEATSKVFLCIMLDMYIDILLCFHQWRFSHSLDSSEVDQTESVLSRRCFFLQ